MGLAGGLQLQGSCTHHGTCVRLLSSHVRNEAIYCAYIAQLLGRLPSLGSCQEASQRPKVYLCGDSHCLSGDYQKILGFPGFNARKTCPGGQHTLRCTTGTEP